MRKLIGLLATAAVAATALTATTPLQADAGQRRLVDNPPNIVFVLVDDMRADDLAYMPATRRLLADGGVEFSRAYAVNPLCCPSRASILTGQYAHNTGVMTNNPPDGGFTSFDDRQTIATWLDSAGYTTGYLGKYLNHYPNTEYMPPGWDIWQAMTKGTYDYFGPSTYNVNGTLEERTGYQSDVLTEMATTFVRERTGAPYFLFLSYVAPHGGTDADGRWIPPTPAPRHESAYDGVQVPQDASYNEKRVADKPQSLQQPLMSTTDEKKMRARHEHRLESLLAVDDGVQALVATLRATGQLDNTYLVFTSDNGNFQGEHRYPLGKGLHYEPVSKVPLLVRGPGLPVGEQRRQVVGLHDLAPTFLGWAAAAAPEDFVIDGADLMPLLTDATLGTGRDLLIEGRSHEAAWQEYDAIRANRWKYVEYVTGEVEMYNLSKDPAETENLAGRPRRAARQAVLADRLAAVRACVGAECR
jgi:arylsulfatase A-like enzyme